MKQLSIGLALALATGLALAQASPVGLWKTIDDKTNTEKSLLRIAEAGGVFSAKVEKILEAGKADAKCDQCTDDRKDKPIVGMTIIRNVRAHADDKNQWDGGDILDPNDGKVYRVRLRLEDGGRKLAVRGYIGAPMLGRTQTWIRVE